MPGVLLGAMLTGMVNIAVFAAFRCVIGSVLRSDAAFKRVCADRPLDVWRYGWQKRQETATMWQRMATWAAKNGTVWQGWQGCGRMHVNNHMLACGCGWRCLWRYVVVKVREPCIGPVSIELIYHISRRLSRVASEDCRDGGQIGRASCR